MCGERWRARVTVTGRGTLRCNGPSTADNGSKQLRRRSPSCSISSIFLASHPITCSFSGPQFGPARRLDAKARVRRRSLQVLQPAHCVSAMWAVPWLVHRAHVPNNARHLRGVQHPADHDAAAAREHSEQFAGFRRAAGRSYARERRTLGKSRNTAYSQHA